ncbi:unnamed protein product [Alopecurus aequalis]
MKNFLILALLAMAATMATAQYDPSEDYEPYLELQQPYLQQQQQQYLQQQQPYTQLLRQQLNPCRQFLLQQCSPVATVPFLRSQILQQSSCQVMRQQCCRQLAQLPEQLRCPAIHSVVQAIIMQQLQQQQGYLPQQQGYFQPQQQSYFQPQAQQMIQGFFQPQQQAQLEGMRAFALQALPAMCDVYVPPHCPVAIAPVAGL